MKVVHTSTCEVYGTAQLVPIAESHPLQGQLPYSASRISADQLAYSFFASFGLPISIVRPFNTYGPRQSARAVTPTIITQIACGQRLLRPGAVYPTRDFNYVQDTVSGFIAAAESKNGIGKVVNLGSNFEISIGDTVALIAEVMGVEVSIADSQCLRPENSEVERLWASNDKVRALFGWQPAFAGREGMRRGLQHTVAWFTEPGNLAVYKIDRYNI